MIDPDELKLETDYPDCLMTEQEQSLQEFIMHLMHSPMGPPITNFTLWQDDD